MYFVHTCIIIIIIAFSFFNGSLSQKKIVKVIEDDIYDKLLEILKRSEKFVLAKFYRNVDKKNWRLISNKNVKAKDMFDIVTDILKNGVVKHFSKSTGKHMCSFFDKVVGFQPSSSATVIFL